MSRDVSVGDEIKAGQLLLLSSGSYSGYGVGGLFRAKRDFVMPGKKETYSKHVNPDGYKVTADPELVEELEYIEVWTGE